MNCCLPIVVLLALSNIAHANYQYPAQPVNPTWEECGAFAREYYAILAELRQQMMACMTEEPEFGWGSTCDGSVTLKAWAQCDALDQQICQVDADKDEAISACQISASTNLNSGDVDSMQRFREFVNYGTQLTDLYNQTSTLLSSPKEFFRASAQGELENELRKRFYPGLDLNEDGQEMYQYLFRAAKYGMRETSNPVVGQIQSELLSYFEQRMSDLFYQLDRVNADMSRYSTQ